MLTLHLSSLLNARGIDKPFSWLRTNGFTHSMAYRLLEGPTLVNLSYLEKLCRLLQCTPNDLLLFTPSAKEPIAASHPLSQLTQKQDRGNIADQIRQLPLNQLDKVFNLVEQLQEQEHSGKEVNR